MTQTENSFPIWACLSLSDCLSYVWQLVLIAGLYDMTIISPDPRIHEKTIQVGAHNALLILSRRVVVCPLARPLSCHQKTSRMQDTSGF